MTGFLPRLMWRRTWQQACALGEQAPRRPSGGSRSRGAAPRRARPRPPRAAAAPPGGAGRRCGCPAGAQVLSRAADAQRARRCCASGRSRRAPRCWRRRSARAATTLCPRCTRPAVRPRLRPGPRPWATGQGAAAATATAEEALRQLRKMQSAVRSGSAQRSRDTSGGGAPAAVHAPAAPGSQGALVVRRRRGAARRRPGPDALHALRLRGAPALRRRRRRGAGRHAPPAGHGAVLRPLLARWRAGPARSPPSSLSG